MDAEPRDRRAGTDRDTRLRPTEQLVAAERDDIGARRHGLLDRLLPREAVRSRAAAVDEIMRAAEVCRARTIMQTYLEALSP